MTTVMPNIQERANSQRQANIVYKITQATNLMKANGAMVDGFASTEAFVDELQKYLKIMKRCDSEHIAECWPTKKVRTSSGKEYEVIKAKTGKQLGFDKRDVNNVGIVLTDGASLIMTYDPTTSGISIGEKLIATNTKLPVGGGYKEFLEYTTNSTSGLAFVMDVNGGRGPNSETINNKMYDIRSFNGAHFSTGCAGSVIDQKCYQKLDSVGSLDCSINENGTLNNSQNAQYCPEPTPNSTDKYLNVANDYWAGAKKACADLGMTLPTYSKLKSICQSQKSDLSLPLAGYWTIDSVGGPKYNYIVCYNDSCACNGGDYAVHIHAFSTLCVNDM